MKAVGIILLVVATGGIGYFLWKKYKSAGPAPGTAAAATLAAPVDQPKSDEDKAFEELARIIEADPVFQTKPFPANFYDEVAADYEKVKAGTPRTADYAAGKPGAFMSIADAWKDAMGFSADTHKALWSAYSAYRGKAAKSKIMSFNGLKF